MRYNQPSFPSHVPKGKGLQVLLVFGLFACALFSIVLPSRASAVAGINEQVNYQARLLTDEGAVVPDGTYNMEFKIYQDGNGCVSGGSSPCSGTLKWTETRTSTDKVNVKNGYFSVQLGAVTAFGSSVDWNQDTLWLSINIGGTGGSPTWDGEMTPFRRLSASPYALNAGKLGGLDASKFVQVAPSAVQVDSGTLDSIFLNKTGASGNILRLQKNGTDLFVLTNDGKLALGSVAPSQKFEVQDGDMAVYNSGNNARIIIGDSGVSGQYGYLQWDSTNDYFRIEKNGTNGMKINDNYVSIGNLFPDSPLKVGNGSTLLMSVGTTGEFLSQNSTNSTSAFRVLNVAGTSVFNIDTTNGRVSIGNDATPDEALDVVGNFQVKDGATSTKSYRMRTSGGALDFEASGADLYFSTWSGANYTGTQYNQIVMKADGSSMDFQRGFNVASGFKVGMGGNVAPAETLDVNGMIQQTGRTTSNTGAADNNKWTKLASCTIDAQFEGCLATIEILGGRDGSAGDNTQATVALRARQQAALGSAPIVNVQLNGVSQVITKADIVAVTTVNSATETVVELHGRITNTFEAWNFTPSINYGDDGSKWAWYSTNGFSAALPAGTQTAATYGDAYTDALTATGGVQFLNAASAVIFESDAVAESFVFGSDVTTGKHIGMDYSGQNAVLSIGSEDGNAIYLGQYNAGVAELAHDADLHIIRSTNSTTAFQLLNASDAALFNMDSTNARFQINGAGTDGGGSRVHFGDYGNVIIGEVGTGDTDQLLLYGGSGLTMQTHNGTPIVISGTGTAIFKNSTNSTTAFQFQNAASTSILTVNTTNGNVTINASATTYTQRLCHNQASGATTNMTLGDCAAAGQADLAEFYATTGEVEPGDIVVPSSDGGNYAVKQNEKEHATNTVGIVSTNPTADGIMGYNVTAKSRQPVALVGRVPLKVSLENGPIAIGDRLTPSSIPGTAKKAELGDPSIGIAFEAYSSTSPRVSSLVKAEETDRAKAHKHDLPYYESDPSAWSEGVGKIMAFLKQSDGSQISQEALQEAAFNGGIVAGDTTFNGLASFNKHVLFNSTVHFNGTIAANDSTVGTSTIPAGTKSLTIPFKQPHEYTPAVNITPAQFIDGSFRVTDITPKQFTIELEQAQTTTTTFQWTAIGSLPQNNY